MVRRAIEHGAIRRREADLSRFERPLAEVVDFVDLHVNGYHWPAFNVADSSITVGVALLALRLLLRPAPVPENSR